MQNPGNGQSEFERQYRQRLQQRAFQERALWDPTRGPFVQEPYSPEQFEAEEEQLQAIRGQRYGEFHASQTPVREPIWNRSGFVPFLFKAGAAVGIATLVVGGVAYAAYGPRPQFLKVPTDQDPEGVGNTLPFSDSADAEAQLAAYLDEQNITLEEFIRSGLPPESFEPPALEDVIPRSTSVRVVTVDRINTNDIGDISFTGRVLGQGSDSRPGEDPDWSMEYDVNSTETVTVQTPWNISFLEYEGKRYTVLVDRFNLQGGAYVGWPGQDRSGMAVPTMPNHSVFGRTLYREPPEVGNNPSNRYVDPNDPLQYFTGIWFNQAMTVIGIADGNGMVYPGPGGLRGTVTPDNEPLVVGNGINPFAMVAYPDINPGEITSSNTLVTSVWLNGGDADKRAEDPATLARFGPDADPDSFAFDDRVATIKANTSYEPLAIPPALYLRGSSIAEFGPTPIPDHPIPNDLRSTHEIQWCREAGEPEIAPHSDVETDRPAEYCLNPIGGRATPSIADNFGIEPPK